VTLTPETQYAQSGGVHFAYRVVGTGAIDIVLALGFVSHLDVFWDHPPFLRLVDRLASFSRVIVFDRRGVGLSDPVVEVPTLETRADDIRAVMDAANSPRAALVSISEAAAASILLAATCPERIRALVLYGAMARATADQDYIWAKPREAFVEASRELVLPHWGKGATAEILAPSVADDAQTREFFGRLERQGASPAMAHAMFRAFLETDVRQVLSALTVPTLVLHRRGDRVVNVRAGRWLASRIPGARYVEQPGIDHCPYVGDAGPIVAEIEEFLTGTAHEAEVDRVLVTVLFVDLVASSERVVALGDRRWRDTLEQFYGIVRRQLAQFRGHEIDTAGDGVFATFDGPARAIRCACRIADAVQTLGLAVRSGLHTGECEVLGGKLGGIAVHIGARVAAEAAPNEVVVSSTVKDLVAGSGLRFEDRGARTLKGIPGEWRLFSVARE